MYADDRLAVIYDIDNPDGPDHDFFHTLAVEADARTITDLGCGTGILTVTLAGPGRRVVGIDPAPVMLKRASSRPGGDAVEWVLGTSERIETGASDLIIMSGNVAMHIIGDDWTQTLRDVARGLKPGGRLVFEARNPLAEAWRTWNDQLTEHDTPAGRLRESATTGPPGADGVVTMHCHNEFIDDGSTIDVDVRLQFRSLEQVVSDLAAARLEVINVWRDWARTPFTNTPVEPLMVFEARIGTAVRDRLLTGVTGERS